MIKQSLRFSLLLIAVVLLSSACSISTTNNKVSGSNSSIFLSTNSGNTWRPLVSVPSLSGRPGSIADLNVNVLRIDPEDNLAVYLASFDHGLYYTYKITEGWHPVTSLPAQTVNDVQINPSNKCIIYTALANRVYRSSDCTRTWKQIYFDNNPGVKVNTIAIDYYNPRNIYLGTSRGEIIKTIDTGQSWRTIQRLPTGIAKLIISPRDSRLIFVASNKNEIYSFQSNTNTNANNSIDVEQNFLVNNWTSLNDVLKDFNLGHVFKDLVINPVDNAMYLATNKLILRSPDDGITWENIKLLQPEKDAVINAIALNPKDPKEIYYVTNTTFFRSTDRGVSWTTKKLPTSRAGRALLLDFKNPRNIYLGTIKLKK